ncbi:glycosyltransferase family 2 protein [Cupriavidus pinatubonensis]|uniref:glycosyltransferase family 2 protein n=1 Tax=Cupriavidus pinatubonensis TaxID=248026 RepID=UPI001C73B351|nr:glycosyltransferase family 2 protein [Cupriavidus pinatubonensis]QYY28960.1 glycosyltransferase family 2 protein [Cupriavidus pinatubonensis]
MAPQPSPTHLLLIPSYNPGAKLRETLRAARAAWCPVWVVVDGSTDDSTQWLQQQAREDSGLRVLVLPENQGKGAAVLHGIEAAAAEGFTHALVMDSDGQHPAQLIAQFMAASMRDPDAMVLGRPIFDASAPVERVYWRRVSNFWTDVETLWAGIGDSLYGFRVYPIEPLRAIMRESRWMRRFDFDPEVAVRLCWRGVRPVNLDAPVRYFDPRAGGVSHFRYLRDNLLLGWMHLRLVTGWLVRLPRLLWRRLHAAADGNSRPPNRAT